jgi:hypothetical protein
MILLGITDTLKREGGSGFNNIRVYGITGLKFSDGFGFSYEEIKQQVLRMINGGNSQISLHID